MRRLARHRATVDTLANTNNKEIKGDDHVETGTARLALETLYLPPAVLSHAIVLAGTAAGHLHCRCHRPVADPVDDHVLRSDVRGSGCGLDDSLHSSQHRADHIRRALRARLADASAAAGSGVRHRCGG